VVKAHGKKTRPTAARPSIVGRVTSIFNGEVVGWILCGSRPTQRLSIRIFVDGEPVASAVADLPNYDLTEMQIIDDDRHGFAVSLPAHLLDGQAHAMQVVDSDTKISIGPEPGIVVLGPIAGPGYLGNLDKISDGVVTGWALNENRPNYHPLVTVLIDGNVAVTAVACHFRADLLDRRVGDGSHGFIAFVPLHFLDDQSHVVEVVDTDAGASLSPGASSVVLNRPQKRASFFRQELYQLFDESYYDEQTGVVEGGLEHYQERGWRNGFDPHPLFSSNYYIALYGSQLSDEDPLTHFFNVGQWNGYNTHPLFECNNYLDQRSDVAKTGLHPLFHYLRYGWEEGGRALRFFDEAFYNEENPGIKEANLIPLVHYLRFGWREGRRPHRDFDPRLFTNLAKLSSQLERRRKEDFNCHTQSEQNYFDDAMPLLFAYVHRS
jgi:hypothetical protein